MAGTGGLQPSFVFTTNVYEQFGFPRNSTQVFVGNQLTSTNVVKFQVEDAIYIHSDIVHDGATDVLQDIFVSGIADFSTIAYECKEYQTTSKPVSVATSNVFRFTLTDEDGRVLDLNGLNAHGLL